MNSSITKYYTFALIAYVIPVIGYVVRPGTVVVFSVIQAILIFFSYTSFCKRIKLNVCYIDKWLRYFVIVIILGFFNSIMNNNTDSVSVSLLFTSFVSYLSIIYYLMLIDANSIKIYLNTYLYVLLPTAVCTHFFWTGFLNYDTPHILAPLALFFIISPYIQNFILKIAVVIIYLFSAFMDMSVRSCMLTGVVCSGILILYFITSKFYFLYISKVLRYTFFILPILFLYLGVNGYFNIFQEMENTDVSLIDTGAGRKSEERSLNTDSRTAIYLDVLHSVGSRTAVFVGKGEVINLPTTWTNVRHSVEAGILNIFLKYGLVGCFVFFMIFWHSTKLGIYDSNNTLTKLVAVYLSYKFLYMFIEDSTINISTFIAYGICMNKSIRRLTDAEIKKVLAR